MNDMSNDLPWSEQYRIIAKKWCDAAAAANLLEETKSAMLARLMTLQGDMPVSRAEMNVKAGDDWGEFIEQMVEARKQASLLKVHMEYIRMKFSEQIDTGATRRAEMKL